ncbi:MULTISPECIES: TIGR02444 family protein [unclassified Pseudomonas]|uniref:TIGR02444 family protein n=1 Tax=unclassified Pseudomonas TaxID=196821 RepID=UPI0030DCDB9A
MSSDLWSFSLATYARPGVENTCLHMQAAGTNVCLLLCGLWLEQRGVTCSEQRVRQLQMLVEPWDAEVVQPLRALRTQWKSLAKEDPVLKGLRDQMKALELEAERHLLWQLEQTAQDWPLHDAPGAGEWLESLATTAARLNRDALQRLRVAAAGT